jgi:hypothetical protein
MTGQQLAMCQGKTAFPTWGHANRAAKKKRGRTAYRCPYCHLFHFGGKP